MSIVSIVIQGLLGLGFLMFGVMKFGSKQMVDEFKRYGMSSGFRVLTGLLEIAAAALVVSGIWNEKLAAWGGLLIVVIMLGAIATHIKMKDAGSKMGMPIVLLVLGLIVLLLNWSAII
jgi:putative oxidoreductase